MTAIRCAACHMTAVAVRYRNLMLGGAVNGRPCCASPRPATIPPTTR